MYHDDCDEYDSLYTAYHYDPKMQPVQASKLKSLKDEDVIKEFNNAKCGECFTPCCGGKSCCINCLFSTFLPCFPIFVASAEMNDMMVKDENGCVNCVEDPWTSGVISAVGCSTICVTGCISPFALIPAATASILETVGCLSVAFPAIFNGWRWDNFRYKAQEITDDPKCGSSMLVFLNGLFCTPCMVFETHKRSVAFNMQLKNLKSPEGNESCGDCAINTLFCCFLFAPM